VSTREYNFTTDRIFDYLSHETGAKLHALALADHARLAKVLADNFTSYDGFHSHYSPDLSAWVDIATDELDHNGWLIMLTAAVGKGGTEQLRVEIEEYMLADGGFTDAYQAIIDWPKFEEAVADERAEKLAEIRIDDPYYEPAYRCPETPDMFRAA
jgi:hypothetical protein